MADRYEQLTNDLKLAAREAKQAASKTDDGGTCNLDAVRLRLPNWSEDKVIDAVEKSGSRAYKKNSGLLAPSFIVNLPWQGQANKRNAAAEKAVEVLKEKGYEASVFYMVD